MRSEHTVGAGLTLVGAGVGGIMALNPAWLPEWLDSHPSIHLALNLVFIGMMIVGVTLFFVSDFRALIGRLPHGILQWHINARDGKLYFCFDSWLPVRFLMPLNEAALIAYDATANSSVTRMISGLAKHDAEAILNTVAGRIARLVPIFGASPPGVQLRLLEGDAKMGVFHNGGRALVNGLETRTDIHIYRAHLSHAIKIMLTTNEYNTR